MTFQGSKTLQAFSVDLKIMHRSPVRAHSILISGSLSLFPSTPCFLFERQMPKKAVYRDRDPQRSQIGSGSAALDCGQGGVAAQPHTPPHSSPSVQGAVGGWLLPLRREPLHLRWKQLRLKRRMMPSLSKRIRKRASIPNQSCSDSEGFLFAQRLRLNFCAIIYKEKRIRWLRKLPNVGSPSLSANVSILSKTKFANPRTLRKLFISFRKKK